MNDVMEQRWITAEEKYTPQILLRIETVDGEYLWSTTRERAKRLVRDHNRALLWDDSDAALGTESTLRIMLRALQNPADRIMYCAALRGGAELLARIKKETADE